MSPLVQFGSILLISLLAWLIWRSEGLIRGLVLLRASALLGLVLLLLPPLAVGLRMHMLANVFVLTNWWELFYVSLLAPLVAWQCGFSCFLIWQYGSERMTDVSLPLSNFLREQRVLRVLPFGLLAVPLLVVIYLEAVEVQPLPPILFGVGAASGVLAVTALLGRFVFTQLERWMAEKIGDRLLAALPEALTAGYLTRNAAGRVIPQPGHSSATAIFLVMIAAYVFGQEWFHPLQPEEHQLPALAYVLVLFLLLGAFLPGVTFFFDRFRVPLVPIVLVWTLIAYSTADHHFHVRELGGNTVLPTIGQTIDPLLDARAVEAPARKPTVIVVCASGGGIQAAAWTTRVLTWLHEDPELKGRFTPAVRLYSSTSGGSVGVMYFVESYIGLAGPPQNAERLEAIRLAGSRSSLSHVGWGVVFPDFRRTYFPYVLDEHIDRGWAVEQAWRRPIMPQDGKPIDTRLSDWVLRARQGQLPGVVFNSYIFETGERMLLSTVQLPNARQARTFANLYATEGPHQPIPRLEADLDVVTAARLSATFPYITPISRAHWADHDGPFKLSTMHLGDGAYFDNYGVMAAVEWVDQLLSRETDMNGRPYREQIGRVVIVELRAFPEGGALRELPPPEPRGGLSTSERAGWYYAVAGPLDGLLKMRSTTQVARNETELCLLREKHAGMVEHLVFEPEIEGGPLSWHMSAKEIRELDRQQERVLKGPEKKRLVECLLPAAAR